jgi:hypothetical protein
MTWWTYSSDWETRNAYKVQLKFVAITLKTDKQVGGYGSNRGCSEFDRTGSGFFQWPYLVFFISRSCCQCFNVIWWVPFRTLWWLIKTISKFHVVHSQVAYLIFRNKPRITLVNVLNLIISVELVTLTYNSCNTTRSQCYTRSRPDIFQTRVFLSS